MNEHDGRKINRKALEEIRIRAVKRVEAGESPETVIKALGLTRPRIYEWIAKYREGGIDALRSRKAPGKTPKLSGNHLKKIYRLVVGVDPRQLKFEFALWTRGMIRELIKREFSVLLSEVSVGRLLKKIGLSPQRPTRRAFQQDELLVVEWMAKDFPAIKKLAREQKAEIYFGDESSVRSDYHSGTTWAPRGKTPVVTTTGTRHKVNLISAISPRGAMRFMATEHNVDGSVFITFLKRLMAGATQPIFLIVDNHSVHRSSQVRDFVQGTQGRLRLFYLPPYAPEHNPDEHVWNILKIIKLATKAQRMVGSSRNYRPRYNHFFRHPMTKYTLMFGNQRTD